MLRTGTLALSWQHFLPSNNWFLATYATVELWHTQTANSRRCSYIFVPILMLLRILILKQGAYNCSLGSHLVASSNIFQAVAMWSAQYEATGGSYLWKPASSIPHTCNWYLMVCFVGAPLTMERAYQSCAQSEIFWTGYCMKDNGSLKLA